MTIKITHLGVRAKVSENDSYGGPVPYAVVNATWKFLPSEDEHETCLKEMAIAETKEWHKVLTIDDPERYNKWIEEICDFSLENRYDGYGKSWAGQECPWVYLEKFDTFHFREWVSWTTTTKAVLNELFYYKSTGEFLDLYRCVTDSTVLKHFRTLYSYWD